MHDFLFSSTAEQVTADVNLAGKTGPITGVNSGLGLETARVLAARGAHIIGAARTKNKPEDALGSLAEDSGRVAGTAVACELSEPASVRAAVATTLGLGHALNVIICNAGIMALPTHEQRYGIELQFLTNHVGHFLLVDGLLPALSDDGRVVVVSSGAHRLAPDVGIDFDDISGQRTYDPWRHYGQSKLANILFARSLAQRFEGSGRTASSLHPGVIKTSLGRNHPEAVQAFYDSMDPADIKTVAQGAATQCFLAAHPQASDAAGRYYDDCRPAETTALGKDEDLAERLWQYSVAVAAKL